MEQINKKQKMINDKILEYNSLNLHSCGIHSTNIYIIVRHCDDADH